jgi:hypothetical protein
MEPIKPYNPPPIRCPLETESFFDFVEGVAPDIAAHVRRQQSPEERRLSGKSARAGELALFIRLWLALKDDDDLIGAGELFRAAAAIIGCDLHNGRPHPEQVAAWLIAGRESTSESATESEKLAALHPEPGCSIVDESEMAFIFWSDGYLYARPEATDDEVAESYAEFLIHLDDEPDGEVA